jgi:aspartate/methionine/tyrosine aminotransferase
VLLPLLRDDHDWLAARMKDFTALRTLTVNSLRRLPWLMLEPQAGTAYVWPDVSALGLPAPVIAEALLCEASVLISPGYQFGPSAGGISVCAMRATNRNGRSHWTVLWRFSTA